MLIFTVADTITDIYVTLFSDGVFIKNWVPEKFNEKEIKGNFNFDVKGRKR